MMQKKAFDKMRRLFTIKTLKNLGTERSSLNGVKAVGDKPNADPILNGGN